MAESATSVGSFTFLGVFAMVSLCPLTFYASGESCVLCPPQARSRKTCPLSVADARNRAAFRYIRKTSYWQSDANEMAAIKTILIIVNSYVA